MEAQIEKLRVVEIEKQLELKEAATKRKIQALKQQLSNLGPKTFRQVEDLRNTGGNDAHPTFTNLHFLPNPIARK